MNPFNKKTIKSAISELDKLPNPNLVTILELHIKALEEALGYYADSKNWEYTDCGGQFDWYATIKNDVWRNPKIDEGGGIDYAGKRAREALGLL
jgi:hypothetical protein